MNKATELIYRKGAIDDLAALKKLGINAYGQYAEVLSEEHWKTFSESLHDENELAWLIHKATVFVCETSNKKIVGMVYFIPSGNPTEVFPKDWSCIRRLGVDVSFRGMKISKQLTQLCIDYAKQTGEKTLALYTSEFMNEARKMYEAFGFEKVKQIDELYGKKYWLYKLELY